MESKKQNKQNKRETHRYSEHTRVVARGDGGGDMDKRGEED